MAGQINTVETIQVEQKRREQIGTWDYSKQLLVNCEADGEFKEEEKPSKNALTCIKDFRERFEEYIKKYNYDIISFDINEFHKSVYGEYAPKEKGVNRPKFDDYIEDGLTGPMICFHDTQGFNVYAEDVKIKNGKFLCKLCFEFYDHFGLDSGDLESFGDHFLVGKGFQSWYLLQHLNEYPTGCKAFVDYTIHEETVEIEIE